MSIDGVISVPLTAVTPAEVVSTEAKTGDVQAPPSVDAKKSQDATPSAVPEAPAKEEPTKADPYASRFVELTRREREIQRQKEAVKAEVESVKAWQSAKELAQSNPMSVLETMGLTYEQLTNFIIHGSHHGDPNSVEGLRAEMKAKADAEVAAKEAAELAAQQADVDAKITTFKGEITSHLETHADDYELTTLNEGEHLIFETVEQFWNEHGKVLSIKEAADTVEEYFAERAEALLKAKKLQAKLSPKPSELSPSPRVNADTPQAQGITTLSNSLQSHSTPADHSKMSDAERLKLAASMIKFT